MPEVEKTRIKQGELLPTRTSNEAFGFLNHGVFLSKFYDDYEVHVLSQDYPTTLTERAAIFRTFFTTWKGNWLEKLASTTSQENTKAFNTITSLSLKSTESFAHNKHVFFKAKSLSDMYTISERLDYLERANKWEKYLNLAFWANHQESKLARLKGDIK